MMPNTTTGLTASSKPALPPRRQEKSQQPTEPITPVTPKQLQSLPSEQIQLSNTQIGLKPTLLTLLGPSIYTTPQGQLALIASTESTTTSSINSSQEPEILDEMVPFDNPDSITYTSSPFLSINNTDISLQNSQLSSSASQSDIVEAPKRPSQRLPEGRVFKTIKDGRSEALQYSTKEISITSPKEIGFVDTRKNYLTLIQKANLIKRDTPTAALVFNLTFERLNQEINSYKAISNLLPHYAEDVVYNRHLYHLPNEQSSKEANQALLGTNGSVFLKGGNNSPYVQPGNEVSIFQETTLQNYSQKVVQASVLSVAMPVLNDKNSIRSGTSDGKANALPPQMTMYLDTSTNPPTLDENAYKKSLETICEHIVKTAEKNKPKYVVFGAGGVTDSLEALAEIDKMTQFTSKPTLLKNTALGIAANAHANMIKQLQEKNIKIYFMDMVTVSGKDTKFNNQSYWQLVNVVLKMINAKPLTVVDSESTFSLPKNEDNIKKSLLIDPLYWITDNILLINPYNRQALVGDGIVKGGTFNSWLGCRTTLNFVDYLVVSQHNEDKKVEDRRKTFLQNW